MSIEDYTIIHFDFYEIHSFAHQNIFSFFTLQFCKRSFQWLLNGYNLVCNITNLLLLNTII